MIAPALLLAAAVQAAPSIDLAIIEGGTGTEARLIVLRADRRLEALCLDREGLSARTIESARRDAQRAPVYLYLGPRQIARGRLRELEAGPSPWGPCAVTATATFDQPLPLRAAGDVLWATTTPRGSAPPRGTPAGAIEAARRVLPDEIAEPCARPAAAAVRGTDAGTYVSLVCATQDGEVSTLVLVRPRAPAQVLIQSEPGEGRLKLLDVLDPSRRWSNRLVLARELEDGVRRIELWSADDRGARRIDWGAEDY